MLHIQFSSVAQSCPTLHNPMSHSPPGLPVHHKLPEFTQIKKNNNKKHKVRITNLAKYTSLMDSK